MAGEWNPEGVEIGTLGMTGFLRMLGPTSCVSTKLAVSHADKHHFHLSSFWPILLRLGRPTYTLLSPSAAFVTTDNNGVQSCPLRREDRRSSVFLIRFGNR